MLCERGHVRHRSICGLMYLTLRGFIFPLSINFANGNVVCCRRDFVEVAGVVHKSRTIFFNALEWPIGRLYCSGASPSLYSNTGARGRINRDACASSTRATTNPHPAAMRDSSLARQYCQSVQMRTGVVSMDKTSYGSSPAVSNRRTSRSAEMVISLRPLVRLAENPASK